MASFEELAAARQRVREQIDTLLAGESIDKALASAMSDTLAAVEAIADATLGECRLAQPFSPLRPILDDDGLRWCCTHSPPHCASQQP